MTDKEFKCEMKGLIDMGLVIKTKPGYYSLNLDINNNKLTKEKDNGKQNQKSG